MPRSTKPPTHIFHRHETGWTTQIEVPQPTLAHLRRIIGITEIDPLQMRAINSLGRKEADRHGVLSFLQDKVWKDGDDLMPNAVRMLVDDVHQPHVIELVIFVDGSHPGVGRVVCFRRRDSPGNAAATVRADDQAAALAQPIELERGKKQMQQTGMVGVARVLRVHLPVVRQHFNKAADDLDLATAKDPVEPRQHLWSNEVLDGRRCVAECAEHEAVERCHTQLSRTVIRYPEVGRHTTLALHPALEGDGLQVAAKVIAPGMVNALKVLGALTRVIEADQGAAVRAAVFEGGDRSVIIADDHYRHPPDNSRTPVAGIGDLVLKAEIIPDRAFENPRSEERRVGKECRSRWST